MPVAPQFRRILVELADADVKYVVIGGVAMSLQGSAYVTQDLDIVYARDSINVAKLASTLQVYHPRPRGFPPDLPFIWSAATLRNGLNFTLQTDVGAVDLLGEAAGAGSYAELAERATCQVVDGREIRTASVADLIAMKRAANRQKDQVHLMELEALQRILSEPSD